VTARRRERLDVSPTYTRPNTRWSRNDPKRLPYSCSASLIRSQLAPTLSERQIARDHRVCRSQRELDSRRPPLAYRRQRSNSQVARRSVKLRPPSRMVEFPWQTSHRSPPLPASREAARVFRRAVVRMHVWQSTACDERKTLPAIVTDCNARAPEIQSVETLRIDAISTTRAKSGRPRTAVQC